MLRTYLKRFGWLSWLNSHLKCSEVKRAYRRTVNHYASVQAPPGSVRRLKRAVRWVNEQRAPRIFFLGTDEQQDRSGTIQALQRFGTVTWFTRADGSYGQNAPAPYSERRTRNTRRLLEMFEQLATKGATPDVLVGQTWGSLIDPVVLSQIRKQYGTFVINLSMDDRHQYWGRKVGGKFDGVFPLIPAIDLALTAAPECVSWYEKEGCPALFFPEASDPDIFHPMSELPKTHDVCFVGGRYGIRAELVLALRQAGIAVAAYGDGWEGGRLPVSDVPRLFAQSKIVLGVGTIGHCSDFYALKLRDFDAPMSGSCYLTNDNADLEPMYDVGHEVVTYRDVPDCVSKVKYYLEHDEEREAIARRGRDRAVRDHTWQRRFADLFKMLGSD